MPIVQVEINEANQASVDEMLQYLDQQFTLHDYTINSLELIHSKRGIICLHEIIHYYIPEKMVARGWNEDEILPKKVMNANGYCGHLYRYFRKMVATMGNL